MIDERPRRIGICGSYGGRNVGDEAILGSIVAQLRRTVSAEVTVFSRDAADTLRRQNVEHAVPVRHLSRREARDEVEKLDVLIVGGGGLLYDRHAERYLRELLLAQEVGVPVMVYAVGAGPLVEPASRALVRQALETGVDVLTVRDQQSRRLLEELGIEREIQVTADPAVLLTDEPLAGEDLLVEEAIDPGVRLVGISLREPGPAAPDIEIDHYLPLIANACDFMVSRFDADVVFFPLERHNDVRHSHGVVARMRQADRATVLKRDYSPGQIVAMLRHFDFAVGMRLHFLIFAALAGVPFVALPYASKVKGFLEALQLAYPPLIQVSAGQLIATLDRAWHDRDVLAAQVRGGLPHLQRRARLNNDLLVDLLRRADLRTAPEAGR